MTKTRPIGTSRVSVLPVRMSQFCWALRRMIVARAAVDRGLHEPAEVGARLRRAQPVGEPDRQQEQHRAAADRAGPRRQVSRTPATASTKKARAGRNAGGPPKSLPQAGDASTTTAARPIATTAPTATGRRPAADEVVGHRDAQHDRGGGEQREGHVAHAVEPAADHRLQAHQRGQLQPRAGHHVGGQHEHRGGRDDGGRPEQRAAPRAEQGDRGDDRDEQRRPSRRRRASGC